MGTRFYGIAVGGQDATDVTIDTLTTSSDIELAVDETNLTAGAIDKRQFVRLALEAIMQSVEEDSGL